MKKSTKRIILDNKTWIMACAAIICVIVMLYPLLPVTSEKMQRSMTMIESRSHYELCLNGKAIIYMDNCDEIAKARLSFSQDSIPYIYRHLSGQWMYRHAFLPICNGTIVIADTKSGNLRKADECNADIRAYIARCITSLGEDSKKTSRKLEELDYYLKTHSVLDEGYNSIADYANNIRTAKENADSATTILMSIKDNKEVTVRFVQDYALLDDSRTRCNEIARDGSLCIIQTHDKTTPADAAPLFLRNPLASVRRPSADICAYFDSDGKFSGHRVATDSNSIYIGGTEHGKRSGYGLTIFPKDKSRFVGKWNADTIEQGTRIAAGQHYSGHLNAKMQATGFGTSSHSDGTYYEGEWQDGKRSGFGWGLDSAGNVRSGEWRNDKYRGERLLYTSERIYGIDISRHQHEKGRKRYPINWSNVRITHLGKISNKRVDGPVNYPVSFVYIKSTEGITIRNKYYASDYAQARKYGIKCGAYHFFSLKSDAKRQANYFISNSRFGKGDFPPVLDVEPSDSQIRKAGGTEAMFRMIRTWLTTVENRTGVRPILYVGQQFVNKYLPLAPDILDNYKVWIARYGEYKPDVKLVFWQLCPDGRVSGIHGDVDINVFNGYQDVYGHFLDNERF